MIVQFDLGNSSIKWRVVENGCRIARGFFLHGHDLPEDLASKMGAALECQVSSVANDGATQDLLRRLRRLGVTRLVNAESQREQLGLVSAYADPATMGVDRWLAMLGAWHQSRKALLVVDAGSAVTIDVVLSDGRHEGGFIIPGRRLMLASLQKGTSRVLFGPGDDPVAKPGVDTQSCVARGLSWLWRGLATQIQLTAAEHGIDAVWVTGGDARHLKAAGLEGTYIDDLVLDGLALYCDYPPGLRAGQ